MVDQVIYGCQACFPSLERAKRFVLRGFSLAGIGFSRTKIKSVLFRMGRTPQLVRQYPSCVKRSSILPAKRTSSILDAALRSRSTRTSPNAIQAKSPLTLATAPRSLTTLLKMATLSKVDGQQDNEVLMNCLEDAAPIGVMNKEALGYKVWGLAYVECYNSMSRMFMLYGPINARTEALHLFDYSVSGGLSPNERKVVESADE